MSNETTPQKTTHELWEFARKLRAEYSFVDLTHSFHAGQPKFSALPDEERTRLFTVADHGFEIDQYQFVGQWAHMWILQCTSSRTQGRSTKLGLRR